MCACGLGRQVRQVLLLKRRFLLLFFDYDINLVTKERTERVEVSGRRVSVPDVGVEEGECVVVLIIG
jgi:hypothetical protein